jgi:2-polyprenyl-3-methyl-5-hydroxy-6-metoxy-1,4-benzoquinol methylase
MGRTLMVATDGYVLGHTDAELKRLATQARLIDPITQRFLVSAGITEGMRVLDVGSGAGDVAILLAGLVGPTGEVVGTDSARSAIDAAEKRIRASSLANVTFRHGDPAAMTFDKPFDAVVGRYVLQFIPNPSAAIARLSRQLHPDGLMFFHELDWDGARSSPPIPTYDRACGWILRTIEGSGAQIRLGAHLASLFEMASLSRPTLRLESVIASGPAAIDAIHLVTDLVATLLPSMERMGIVKASEVELATLAQRILAEVGADGTLVGRAEVAAWATV